MQHIGHNLEDVGVDFIFHPQVNGPLARFVVVHTLVPVVQQSGKACLLRVDTILLGELFASVCDTHDVLEAFRAHACFQLGFACLVKLFREWIDFGRLVAR